MKSAPSISGDRDKLCEPEGSDVPPASLLRSSPHPLLSYDNPRIELVLSNVQTPEYILHNAPTSALTSSELAMVGSLGGMCSVDEMLDKQRTCTANDLERLNVVSASDTRFVNRHLAVKSFQRSDASKVFMPGDTRPILWCRRTVHNVLMLQIEADCTLLPWLFKRDGNAVYRFLDVYNFVRDRLRGVWTDLTVQHCECHRGTIECLEISSRFLILAEELLCEEGDFDAVQNGSLLSTCLEKLMACYASVRRFQGSADYTKFKTLEGNTTLATNLNASEKDALIDTLVWESPYEAEFWSYRLLLCLSHGSQSSASVAHVLTQVPKVFLANPMVRTALEAITAFKEGNVLRYFKYKERSPYLMSLLMSKFGNLLRMRFLFLVSGGSRAQSLLPYPLFLKLFNFEDEPSNVVEDFCDKNDIQILTNPETGAPEQISVSNVSISLEDLRPRRLRCKRFRSAQLQRKFQNLKLSRKQLLDPSLPPENDLHPSLGISHTPRSAPTLLSVQPPRIASLKSWKDTVPPSERQPTTPIFRPPLLPTSEFAAPPAPNSLSPGQRETPSPTEPLFSLGSLVQSPAVLDPEHSPAPKAILKVETTPDYLRCRLSQPFGNLVSPSPERPPAIGGAPEVDEAGEDRKVPHFGLTEDPDSEPPQPASRPQKRKQAEVNSKRQPFRRDTESSEIAGSENAADADPKKKTRRAEQGSYWVPPLSGPASVPSPEAVLTEKLSKYREALGAEISLLLSTGFKSPMAFARDFQRAVESSQLLADFSDTSVEWAIRALEETLGGFPKFTANESKVCEWNICLSGQAASPRYNSLKVILESVLFGVSSSSSEDLNFKGALSNWTGSSLCASMEEGPGFMFSKWIRTWRLRDRTSLGVLSVTASAMPSALDKRHKVRVHGKFLMMWVFQKPILVRRSDASVDPAVDDVGGTKIYRLCNGMTSAFSSELDTFVTALSSCEKSIDGTATFLVQMDIVLPPSGSSNFVGKDLFQKVSFLEKMNLRLSQRMTALIRKKLAVEKFSLPVSRLLEETASEFEKTQEAFVFICALAARENPQSSPLAETPGRSNSGNLTERVRSRCLNSAGGPNGATKRWASWSHVSQSAEATYSTEDPQSPSLCSDQTFVAEWHLVPLGLSRAFGFVAKSGQAALQTHLGKVRDMKKGAAAMKLFKELPLKIHWSRRTTETLPFVLTTLWKRELEKVKAPRPSVEIFLQALPKGLKSFLSSPLWEVSYIKAKNVAWGFSDSEDTDEEHDEDCDKIQITNSDTTTTVLLKNRAIIQKVLKRIDKLITKLCVSNHIEMFHALERAASAVDLFKSEGSSEASTIHGSSLGADTSCFYEARKLIRGIIKYALDPATSKHPLPCMRIALRLPYPLYLLTSCRDIPPWNGRPLPNQFYNEWKNTASPRTATSSSHPQAPPETRLQAAKAKAALHQKGPSNGISGNKAKTDIFEIVRKRMENASENLVSTLKQDKRRLDCILNAKT